MKQTSQVEKCESGINLGIYLTLPDIVYPTWSKQETCPDGKVCYKNIKCYKMLDQKFAE